MNSLSIAFLACSRRSAIALGLLVAFAGCQSSGPRLTAEQKQIRDELRQISPRRDSLAKNSPIIDIHTHTFNARYLPLHHILLGKRDAFPPITWLISDSCARTLAAALIELTELGAAAGQPAVTRPGRGMHVHEHRDQGLICGVFLGLLTKAAAEGCWEKGLSPQVQLDRLDRVADTMTLPQQVGIMAATHMMGMGDRLKGQSRKNALRGAVRFLWFLTQNDAAMTRLFRFQYKEVPMRDTPLMVSHMMDLGPVYDQAPNGTELLDFEKAQVCRMEEFQRRPGSNMIYFVAYNPYRDHWKGGSPGNAQELVRSAIEKHGAWGVKVYPPSGYRPFENDIKPRPTGIRARSPDEQWDARYAALGKERNSALDQKLEDFLEWCIKKDVPVFVHAGTGEFEARKGYGAHHSNPEYWRKFLEKHSRPKSPCRLRLCLGHAGGEDFWFGGKKYSSWGKEVYEMCRRFPNAYCEITTHADLVDPNKQAFFVDHLAKPFDDSRLDDNQKPYPYSFRTKLLYGTDWYLPDASDRDTVLLATEQAFLHKNLCHYYKDYFFGNALRYLNAGSRLNETRHRLSGAIQRRLEQALALRPE